jgi:hypothetical protein
MTDSGLDQEANTSGSIDQCNILFIVTISPIQAEQEHINQPSFKLWCLQDKKMKVSLTGIHRSLENGHELSLHCVTGDECVPKNSYNSKLCSSAVLFLL